MPESSSSTDPIPPDHVVVGRVGKPHGLAGDVFVFPETDHPDRFSVSAEVFVDGRATTVAASRSTDDRLVVRFAGVTGRPQAELLRGFLVTIPEHARRALEPDEWWPDQLVGLRVLDHHGVEQGTVIAVVEGVAQDRLVVRTDVHEVEIPFVEQVVPAVDVEAGIIRLAPIEGLLTEP